MTEVEKDIAAVALSTAGSVALAVTLVAIPPDVGHLREPSPISTSQPLTPREDNLRIKTQELYEHLHHEREMRHRLRDMSVSFQDAMRGPGVPVTCLKWDWDGDGDADLRDWQGHVLELETRYQNRRMGLPY